MDFTLAERNTIIAALNLLRSADDATRAEASVLSGGLGKPEQIAELVEYIERGER